MLLRVPRRGRLLRVSLRWLLRLRRLLLGRRLPLSLRRCSRRKHLKQLLHLCGEGQSHFLDGLVRFVGGGDSFHLLEVKQVVQRSPELLGQRRGVQGDGGPINVHF